ncbi:EcsC family protein [Pedococcus sp. 5OH_020]|uniref:EcsC family protein n=1 Tax=Pedococcus sp. 5OH_020 TaxID=2989814 RepID=UPI0022E9E24A|nr:EcsC family protein [Pedococcus sp. 5OH_020]
MGFLGLGKDGTAHAAEQGGRTGSALERARNGHREEGMFSGAVTGLVEQLLDAGIDGRGPFDSAQTVADVRRAEKADAEQAVEAVVRSHVKLAAAGGFVTGLGGFITLPVALPVNVLEFYIVATRMVAAVATLRGYDTKQPEIRSAVLLTLVGAESEDLLRKAGVATTGRLSNLAAQRLPGPALLVVNKAVGFRLLASAGKKTLSRFGKGVPVVGGVIGAGLDGYLLTKIAEHARHEFPPRTTAL